MLKKPCCRASCKARGRPIRQTARFLGGSAAQLKVQALHFCGATAACRRPGEALSGTRLRLCHCGFHAFDAPFSDVGFDIGGRQSKAPAKRRIRIFRPNRCCQTIDRNDALEVIEIGDVAAGKIAEICRFCDLRKGVFGKESSQGFTLHRHAQRAATRAAASLVFLFFREGLIHGLIQKH